MSDFRDKIEKFLLNDDLRGLANIVINFSVGFVLSATSFGLLYFMIFSLAYNIFLMFLTKGRSIITPIDTAVYIYAGLSGFILGRSIAFRFSLDPIGQTDITSVNLQDVGTTT